MQGMSLSVNAVSEVREFTTTTGRTVYVLDGRADFDLDALIAACTSRACAPPPVGTGGSLPTAVQHVTSREAAALIKSGGFLIGRGQMHGAMFGNGIYLSMAGDERASRMYRSGVKTEGYAPALVKGSVRLRSPLKVSGDSLHDVALDMIEQMGGEGGVKRAAKSVYDKMRSDARAALKKVMGDKVADAVDWDKDFEHDDVFNNMTREQYAAFSAEFSKSIPFGIKSIGSRIGSLRRLMTEPYKSGQNTKIRSIANLLPTLGYDGIEITNTGGFDPVLGGSQIVVFDPKAITVESVEDFGALIERFGVEVTLDYAPVVFACTSRACAPPPVGKGGSLPSGGSRLPNGADPEKWAARAMKLRNANGVVGIEGYKSMSAAEYTTYVKSKTLQEKWEQAVPNDPRVRMRVDAYVLRDIMRDGRFKTQHETGTSGGYLSPETRDRFEEEVFATKSPRPKYGYVAKADDPFGPGERALSDVASSALDDYGNIVVEFKRDVERRTSVTVGDSLTAESEKIAPIMLDDIADSSWERRAAAMSIETPIYTEAQIHGDLSLDDVARIIVTETDYGIDDVAEVLLDLKSKYPSVEIVVLDGDDLSSFSMRTEHGEFACTSRACAPPPVGRGGSLPSGGGGSRFSPRSGADPEPHARRRLAMLTSGDSKVGQGSVDAADREFRKRMPENPAVRSRVPLYALHGISTSGRFKNQHETGYSGIAYQPDSRMETEREQYGDSVKSFPFYGYLTERGEHHPWGNDDWERYRGSEVAIYGGVIFEFKPRVNDRTTVTFGDSISPSLNAGEEWQMRRDGSPAPIPVNDVMSVTKERRAVAFGGYGYFIEAQVHDPLRVSDISRIYVQRGETLKTIKGTMIPLGSSSTTGTKYGSDIEKQIESVVQSGDYDEYPITDVLTEMFPYVEIVEVDPNDYAHFSSDETCEAHGEFACTSRACAPPPVGTGGSLPTAVQHVTSREAAALIKSGGFIVGRGEMHGSKYGYGIYLSMAGDKQATELYRKGTKAEGHAPALVRATVRLKNSLKVSGDTSSEVFHDMVKKLGGRQGVIDAATKSYGRLRDGAKTALRKVLGEDAVKRVNWDGEFETDPVFNDMTSRQYADFVVAVEPYLPHGLASFGDLSGISTLRKVMEGKATMNSWSRAVSNLVADLGYDGIEITNPRFSAEVGGSQIVVFDPKAITVESVEDFGALIERFGVEVTLDYAPVVFACTEHGEFACTSKECAPPPVGRGGSLPSGSAKRWSGGAATVPIAPKSPLTLTEKDVKSNWAESSSEILRSIGANREPYPDGFKVSQAEADSIGAVARMWIHDGAEKCQQLRKIAAWVTAKGIDEMADATKDGELTFAAGVARTLVAIRSAPVSTVWRGLGVSQEVLDQWKVGGVYKEVLATATGRKQLAIGFSTGVHSPMLARSGTIPVLLKMSARNIPIGGSESGGRLGLADERFVSGNFRIVSIKLEEVAVNTYVHLIEVEQIDGD